jgi:hypothetical protein
VRLCHGDALVVDKGSVLDGVNAGFDCPFYGLCAVGVRGDFPSRLVRGVCRNF